MDILASFDTNVYNNKKAKIKVPKSKLKLYAKILKIFQIYK